MLPLGEDGLEGLRFGGKRNYGNGEVELKETQMVDRDELDYSRLEGARTYHIELMTPFVLESAYPETNDRTIPWWAENHDDLRLREQKRLEQREVSRRKTVDHGQVVKYLADARWRPRRTASSGSALSPDTASENCG